MKNLKDVNVLSIIDGIQHKQAPEEIVNIASAIIKRKIIGQISAVDMLNLIWANSSNEEELVMLTNAVYSIEKAAEKDPHIMISVISGPVAKLKASSKDDEVYFTQEEMGDQINELFEILDDVSLLDTDNSIPFLNNYPSITWKLMLLALSSISRYANENVHLVKL